MQERSLEIANSQSFNGQASMIPAGDICYVCHCQPCMCSTADRFYHMVIPPLKPAPFIMITEEQLKEIIKWTVKEALAEYKKE